MGLTAAAQGDSSDDLYPVSFDKTATKSMRQVTSVSLGSPCYGTQTVNMDNNGNYVWNDHTSNTLKAVAGETLSLTFTWGGRYMHSYLYIDTGADGFTFGIDATDRFTPTGDLVAYSYYNGKNSKGETLADGPNSEALPTFTAPATAGTYRMRFKVDWDNIDPAGSANITASNIAGTVVDVMLNVTAVPTWVKADYTPWFLDRTGWVVTAQNETALGLEGGSSGPDDALLDGDTESYWHSNWDNGSPGLQLPQCFTIDLGSEQELAGFAYLPRPLANNGTFGNGTVKSYKFFVSNTPYDVTSPDFSIPTSGAYLEGTFSYDNGREWKMVNGTSSVSGRYVLFVSTEAINSNGYASCAEFQLMSKDAIGKSEELARLNLAGLEPYEYYNSHKDLSSDTHSMLPGYIPQEKLDQLETALKEYGSMLASGGYWAEAKETGLQTARAAATAVVNYPTDVYFTLTNARGSIVYDPEQTASDGTSAFLWYTNSLDNANENHLWAFYHNTTLGEYYLYNVGKKQFANSNGNGSYGKTWIFSDTPSAIDIEAMSTVPNLHIQGDGRSMSISTSYGGPVITYYASNDEGVPFRAEAGSVSVDNDVTAAIEELVAAHNLEVAKEEAREVLSKVGVGYPTETASARGTLQSALDNATDYATLHAAVAAYKSTTTDIQMPEDGHAYTFTAVLKNGTRRYMNYTGEKYDLVTTQDADNSNYPMSATLVCHELSDGTYIFTNNSGKYLIWRGKNDGGNNIKGYLDSYDAAWCPFTISKLMNGGNVAAGSQDKLFGYMGVQGYRSANTLNYFVVKAGSYEQAASAFYDDSNSSAILIEEVDYANHPELKVATGIDGIDAIATFSAPFATIIPSGVQAWYVSTVSTNGDGEEKAVLTEITEAIPANTGVLLTGAVNDEVWMAPAADEVGATVTGNLLGHSAGADKVLSAETDYILTGLSNVVAFYPLYTEGSETDRTLAINRAYLDLGSNAVRQVRLSFGGEVTGIEAATTAADNAHAPLYDLSGRRVQQAQKGGIYVREGKKFIVK